jgi:siroheme synthase
VLRSLQPGSATLVVLMGIATRRDTAALLLERGWPHDTPAAVLFSVSHAEATSWQGTLATLPAAPDDEGPGVIVIGATVALAAQLSSAFASASAFAGGPDAVAR